MLSELVHTTTSDGLVLHGALFRASASLAATASVDAALLLHGVGGSFYNAAPLTSLVQPLVEAGVHVLSANTRGHDFVSLTRTENGPQRTGAAYETVGHCHFDIHAWSDYLAQQGCSRIGLVGHSLGAIKSLYATVHNPHPATGLVVAISPPCLSFERFMNGPRKKLFRRTMDRAQKCIDSGRPDELIRVKYPFPLLITAAGYVEKYGPDEKYNLLRFADRLPCPALFVYGELELGSGSQAFADLPAALDGLAYAHRTPWLRTIPAADHLYSGVRGQLAQVIVPWLLADRA